MSNNKTLNKFAGKNSPGFTLLEVIVALSIFLTATLIFTMYAIEGWNANRFTIEQTEAIEHAKKGIISMTKEIREASPSDNGDYPILEASDQSFTFYSDIDLDEMTEKVNYYLDGTNLTKQIYEAAGDPVTYATSSELIIISEYVRNATDPIFYYYAGGDLSTSTPMTTPADPLNIKLVKIYLKININPLKAPDSYELHNSIQLRNLKDNL